MNYEYELEQHESEYYKLVQETSDKIYYDLVVPYCKRYNLRFLSGNGTFSFYFTDETKESYKESHRETSQFGANMPSYVPDSIAIPLNLAMIKGWPIGSYMKDYPDNN